ncbi:MAG: NADH:ubiquinone reductase (Na(+)-transporting) subunit D [Mesotoga sp.]|jgi:Na+-transporting NADH:ubiquinone oxidoreductase subunit D|uniref:NADH:ubiquinone reductase (Na(+)-transporting) subunit D n=3 Tax=Mesotoga TaxID=1184396 RepID=UPI000EF28A05|nr:MULTISPECIES: NADH:ubiquinone reductase (Na(+)-transporting) subunit D [unclassified Mesotoga]MDI9368436.1 NADH:ubiquinone reductase (Na(+)-transporting) subunit D [Thermotogota bacterium]NLT44268.1 NADH:ubiquinone reductase (Na(+)-transporting) subunit D [Thermotogaceae bacterium]MDD2334692.1 NADH:ubiquinone reductase (Na(+)-transporting) subunit D [Mesotoga sp.]MDD3680835.1 NADH:ubiquinone reductase (Na(+)-transporting) subunit D [Mesotoga sp.]MDD4207419.1 NADH:ubiquinone reductase (Na(+)
MAESKKTIFLANIWKNNPVIVQILGICSALAVTNNLTNTLIMGIGLIFTTAFSSLTISALRRHIPKNVRMMVQVLIIATYVIILDIVLKAYLPSISKALGPYVGLIITNCIIMGRAEAFAQSHGPVLSFIDGISAGIGYSLILLAVAFIRELLGFGTLFGLRVMPEGFTPWVIMIMAPSAFFILGAIIWIARTPIVKKK